MKNFFTKHQLWIIGLIGGIACIGALIFSCWHETHMLGKWGNECRMVKVDKDNSPTLGRECDDGLICLYDYYRFHQGKEEWRTICLEKDSLHYFKRSDKHPSYECIPIYVPEHGYRPDNN